MSSIFQLIGAKTKTELDKKLALAGGTLTGNLTLSGAPSSNLHAATKAYVDTVASDASSIQTELNDTQSGAGLGTDGAYSANGSANYISSASSLVNADTLLDAQIKTNADSIASNASDISTNSSSISTNATAIDTVEASVGLSTAGAFSISGDYFGASSNLVSAVESLDDQVAANASAISSNDSDISTLQSNVSSNDSDIATLQSNVSSNDSDISTLQSNVSSNDSDISDLETATSALATDGASASFSGNLGAANLTLSGNLTVSGTTTTVETTNIDVADSIMNISKGASGSTNASNDGGFIVERGSSENNAAFIWDEGDDKFKVLTTSATAASSDISSSDGSAARATLDVGTLEIAGDELGAYSDFVTGLEGGSSGSGS
jgi:hypothetical protein